MPWEREAYKKIIPTMRNTVPTCNPLFFHCLNPSGIFFLQDPKDLIDNIPSKIPIVDRIKGIRTQIFSAVGRKKEPDMIAGRIKNMERMRMPGKRHMILINNPGKRLHRVVEVFLS